MYKIGFRFLILKIERVRGETAFACIILDLILSRVGEGGGGMS